VYLPIGRAGGSINILNSLAADTNVIINLIDEPCREVAREVVCYFYYPPCGNSTTFEPPISVCQDECAYVNDFFCITLAMTFPACTLFLVLKNDLMMAQRRRFLDLAA